MSLRRLPTLFVILLVAVLATRAEAAVTIDIDCDRLRQAPEVMALVTRLQGDLPATATAKIAVMKKLLAWDPVTDLHRVTIDVPADGAPTVRAAGVPADKIADFLSLRGGDVAMPGGLQGHPLPNRPNAVFIALDANDALIGRGELLARQSALPAAPPAPTAAVTIHFEPRPDSEPTLMTLVAMIDATADGNGNLNATITAHDEKDAVEFARRVGVIRDMVAVGAKGGLPRVVDAQQVLDHTTLTRDGAVLHLAITLPADLHKQIFARIAERIEAHLGHHGGAATAPAAAP
jgi:hypothetical protein